MGALISTGALADLLASDQGPAVLDVRWALGGPPGREEYARGHIPGAVFVDLDSDLAGAPGAQGRHPLPGAAAFEAAMRAAGVRGDRRVVVYDAATSMAAARAWWLLRYFGHPDVAVLDGGLAAWVAGGARGVGRGVGGRPGDFVARPGGMPLLDAAGAAELVRRGVLLDARAPERFRGEQEPIDPVAGHIPGARNVPTAASVGEDGSVPQGRRAAGRVYCGRGVAPRGLPSARTAARG